jgi:hypothetical protein
MEASTGPGDEPGQVAGRLRRLEADQERLRSRLTALELQMTIARAVQEDQLGRLWRRVLELQVVVLGDGARP